MPATLAVGNLRRGVLDREIGTDQVDAQNLGNQRDICVEDVGHAARNAGIGEHHVEPAEPLHRQRDGANHILLIAGIDLDRVRDTARLNDRGGGIVRTLGLVGNDDLPAFAREQHGGGAADARTGPGDDDRFAGESCHCLKTPFALSLSKGRSTFPRVRRRTVLRQAQHERS
jgi:hypothetical protein